MRPGRCTHIIIYAITAVLLSFSAYSQHCVPLYTKTYSGSGDDEAKDILYTAIDKGSIVAGRSSSGSSGDFDAMLLKLNESGDILWSKRVGGSADDAFIRVKSAGGGYIAIGTTKSFGNAAGEVFLCKFSISGNLTWARHYGNNAVKTVPKEVIELADGNILFAANENDSTSLGNAIICKVDPTGNVIWTKKFDHGNDDGVNYIVESGNIIYATGYATLNDRDGILMKLDKTTGNIIEAMKMVHQAGLEDEVINITNINNGIAFGAISYNKNTTQATHDLTMFKMRNNGDTVYKRKSEISTISGSKVGFINLILSKDSSFVYSVHDTTQAGFGYSVRYSPTGIAEWSHEISPDYGYNRLTGIDTSGADGLLYAGFINSFYTGFHSRINIFKTSYEGYVESCLPSWIGDYEDTSKYTITPFAWNNQTAMIFSAASSITPFVNDLLLTATAVCGETKCLSGAEIPPGCSNTFLARVKSLRRIFINDAVPLNDGFYIAGRSEMPGNSELYTAKLGTNAKLNLGKTLNGFAHNSMALKSLPSPDGNIVVLGVSEYILDHHEYDSSVLIKLNSSTGDVLWASYFVGDAYDFAATADGGYVIIINRNYGTPPIYNYAVRVNSSGAVVWQKKLEFQWGGDPVFRSILVNGNDIYLGADYYLANPNFVTLNKLNASTGDIVWSKIFELNGRSLFMQSIDKVQDTLFLSVGMTSPNSVSNSLKFRKGMVCLNPDGSIIRAFELDGLEISNLANYLSVNEHRYNNLIKTNDNNFMLGDAVVAQGDTALDFIKFNGSGVILKAVRYRNLKNSFVTQIRQKNGALLVPVVNFKGIFDNRRIYESLLLKTDSNGIVVNGGTGDCENIPVTGVSAIPLSVAELPTDYITVTANNVLMKAYNPYQRPVEAWSEISCQTNSTCDGFHLTGPDLLCNSLDTATYTGMRPPGCSAIVTWNFDAAAVNVLAQTDTSIKVHFLHTGNAYIIGTVSSDCGIVSDTVQVKTRRDAGSLYLGIDTTLCTGNTIVLSAGPGFKSYEWQNGDTHEFLAVNSPGQYYVKVTDSCNNVYADTINVFPGNTISLNLGPDREICAKDTIHINGPGGFINYAWAPDYNISSLTAQSVIVSPLVDTFYFLRAEKTPGCFGIDTVKVKVNTAPVIFLGLDASICTGQSMILDAGAGFSTYQWSDNSIAQTLAVSVPGLYYVMASTSKGCVSKDTINVFQYPLPVINLDKQSSICEGTTRALNPGSFVSYLWQDNSILPTYIATGLGVYYVEVTDVHNCKSSDTVRITTLFNNPSAFLPDDMEICSFEKERIQPNNTYTTYLWNNNSSLSYIMADHAGLYILQVTDEHQCKGVDTIIVSIKNCKEGVFVPAAFSPNNDGKNDVLHALIHTTLTSFQFSVYNRYGQLLFRSFFPDNGWDGKYNGVDQPIGGYTWECRYSTGNSVPVVLKGTSVLIR